MDDKVEAIRTYWLHRGGKAAHDIQYLLELLDQKHAVISDLLRQVMFEKGRADRQRG